MTKFVPMTGQPCDATHPYPTPERSDWVDSMEYGDEHRLPGDTMWDRDSSPIWRAVAAYMWNQPCYEQHLAEVAADPILTAHTMAVALHAHDPDARDVNTRSAFYVEGNVLVAAALKDGGQESARRAAENLPSDARQSALAECITLLNRGFSALRLDVGARFPS